MSDMGKYLAAGMLAIVLAVSALPAKKYMSISTDRQNPSRSSVAFDLTPQEENSVDSFVKPVIKDINNANFGLAASDARTIPVLGALEGVDNVDKFLDYLKIDRKGMHVYPSIEYDISSKGEKIIQEYRKALDLTDLTSFYPSVYRKDGTRFYHVVLYVDGSIAERETTGLLEMPVRGDGKGHFVVSK